MDRRSNLLFAIPLLAALLAFLVTGRLVFTALAFVVGYLAMEGLRFLLLPPHLHSAVQHYRRGELESALSLVKQSIKARPDRWESYYLQALIFFGTSQLDQAEESVRKAIDLHPDSDTNFTTLGQVLASQKRFVEAEEAFSRAVELKGREGVNQYHLGATHYRLERYAEAAPRLELATRLGIENPQLELLAHYYRGRSLQMLGQDQAAQEAYADMKRFRDALDSLQQDVMNVSDYPARTLLQQDIAAISNRIGLAE